MRAAITFDTLEYMDELKRSGMKQEEAEAITKATQKALAQLIETKELATKTDLKSLELNLTQLINQSMWKTITIIVALQTLLGVGVELIKHLAK